MHMHLHSTHNSSVSFLVYDMPEKRKQIVGLCVWETWLSNLHFWVVFRGWLVWNTGYTDWSCSWFTFSLRATASDFPHHLNLLLTIIWLLDMDMLSSKLHIALLDLLQTSKQYCVNTVDHSVSGNKWWL